MTRGTKRGPAIARVTFRRHQALIQHELDEGWFAKAIYERHADKLAGISYRQFLRYANELRDGPDPPKPARPGPKAETVEQLPPQPLTPQPTPTPEPKPEPRSNHVHQPGSTFRYDPTPREDDAQRLWGPAKDRDRS